MHCCSGALVISEVVLITPCKLEYLHSKMRMCWPYMTSEAFSWEMSNTAAAIKSLTELLRVHVLKNLKWIFALWSFYFLCNHINCNDILN